MNHRLLPVSALWAISLRKRIAITGCLIAIATAALVLVGWALDLEILKRIVPGAVAMNPMSAALFILNGAALALLARDDPGRAVVAGTRATGLIVAGIGLTRIAGFVA